MQSSDWPEVERIYLAGIESGMSTFETTSPGWEHWNANHHQNCRLVLPAQKGLAGWVALAPVSNRDCYSGVAEVSIYLDPVSQGQGWGTKLLEGLISEAEKAGFWTLQAVLFPQNQASVRLHKKCGFRLVGRRERIARLNGNWQDTLLFERRSAMPNFQ